MSDLLREWALSRRSLLRSPAFLVGGILTMTCALGSSTAAIGLWRAALPSVWAVPGSERAVNISPIKDGALTVDTGFAPADVDALRLKRSPSLGEVVELRNFRTVVSTASLTRVFVAELFLGDYLSLFDSSLASGRRLTAADAESGGVVVVSQRLARMLRAGPQEAIGQTIRLSGEPHVIVGVAAAGFRGLTMPTMLGADVWVARLPNTLPGSAVSRNARIFARLTDGAQITDAMSDVRPYGLGVVPASEAAMPGVLRSVVVLLGLGLLAVSLTAIAVATSNLASLMLARMTERRSDVAIRVALGASRWEAVRPLLMEGATVVGISAALAIPVASGMVRYVASLAAFEAGGLTPSLAVHPGFDWPTYVGGLALALLTVAVAGAWLLQVATATDPSVDLSSARNVSSGRHAHRTTWVIAGQLVASILLLTGAAIAARNASALTRQDPGIEADHVVVASLDFRLQGGDALERADVIRRLLVEAPLISGGLGAAVSGGLPVGRDGTFVRVPGVGSTRVLPVSPDFFDVLSIAVRGRGFGRGAGADDDPGTAVIVSESVAAALWPEADALGKTLRIRLDSRDRWLTVVGVAGDTDRSAAVAEHRRQIYLPIEAFTSRQLALVVRVPGSAGQVALVQERLQEVFPSLAFLDVRTVRSALASESVGFALFGYLLAGVGAFVVAIASIGLYAIAALDVGLRRKELGVMVALGAGKRDLVESVLRPMWRAVAYGLGLGVTAAFFALMIGRHYLVALSAMDGVVVVVVASSLVPIIVCATVIPVRRAVRFEPLILLRDS